MKSILIIAHDDDTRKGMLKAFEDRGDISAVKPARDAKEIDATLNSFIPDAILLDVVMPTVDGFETLKRLRLDKRLEDTVIIMMSGSMPDHIVSKAIECRANYCMCKPINIPLMMEYVEMLTAIAECEREDMSEEGENAIPYKRVRDSLEDLGISRESRGFEYLYEAICIALRADYIFRLRLVRDVYSVIADKYGVKLPSVERVARETIKTAWDKNPQKMSKLLYVNSKPKTGELIAKVASKLRYSI